MKIIDGKKISNDVLDEIKIVVDERIKNRKKVPHLAAVLVGDDGPSETYVKSKIRACERVGFNSSLLGVGVCVVVAGVFMLVSKRGDDFGRATRIFQSLVAYSNSPRPVSSKSEASRRTRSLSTSCDTCSSEN